VWRPPAESTSMPNLLYAVREGFAPRCNVTIQLGRPDQAGEVVSVPQSTVCYTRDGMFIDQVSQKVEATILTVIKRADFPLHGISISRFVVPISTA
jgi:hypothetical protein